VVHLVAIIAGHPRDFERVMTGATQQLVDAAVEHGVGRLVLMSALGTNERSKDTVPYYRAKWAMEQAVAASGLVHATLRPGFVLGAEGGVLPGFVRQVRLPPVTPVAGDGERRMQPIWIEDVASFCTRALDAGAPTGTFELAGPDVVTWNELFARIASALGKERRIVHLPMGLVRGIARVAELLPRPPLTRDMLTMLELDDNVCDPAPANAAFGIVPIGLDEMLARCLPPRT
jgi:NADH dehydrogenase